MDTAIISSLAIIIFSGLIHSSFQLSVSTLTLLSGHSLGRKTAHRRVVGLMNSFISGVVLLTAALLGSAAYLISLIVNHSTETEQLIAAIISGLLAGLGIATWVFYYRRGKNGTALWLPRDLAHYLTNRAKKTKSPVEALGLGMTSVIAELLFILAPILAAALATVLLPGLWWQILGITLYVLTSGLSSFTVFIMVGSGHRIAQIQAWREANKRFLQFISGGSLLVLATFLFVDRLLGISLYGAF